MTKCTHQGTGQGQSLGQPLWHIHPRCNLRGTLALPQIGQCDTVYHDIGIKGSENALQVWYGTGATNILRNKQTN